MPSPWGTDFVDSLEAGPNAAGQAVLISDVGPVTLKPEIDLVTSTADLISGSGHTPGVITTPAPGSMAIIGPKVPGSIGVTQLVLKSSTTTNQVKLSTNGASLDLESMPGNVNVATLSAGAGTAEIDGITVNINGGASGGVINLNAPTVNVNGVPIGGGSATARGKFTGTTTAAGLLTVPHGLSGTPVIGLGQFVRQLSGGTTLNCQPYVDPDATNLTFFCSTPNGVANGNSGVVIEWFASL